TGHAIVENVDRSSYLDIGIIAARVTHVKTANAGHKLGAVARRRSFWIRRDFPHRRRRDGGIAASAFGTPPVSARCQDIHKICPRWPRKAKARHSVSAYVWA